MRLLVTTAWLVAATLGACDAKKAAGTARTPSVPDGPAAVSPMVETPAQSEASLGLKPVRDSADAVARAFVSLDEQEAWSSKRLRSVEMDSVGYWLSIEFQDKNGRKDTATVLVTRTGAVYGPGVDVW
jgi:hypothetical protein